MKIVLLHFWAACGRQCGLGMFTNKAKGFKSELPVLYLNSFQDIGVQFNDLLNFVGDLRALTFFLSLKL